MQGSVSGNGGSLNDSNGNAQMRVPADLTSAGDTLSMSLEQTGARPSATSTVGSSAGRSAVQVMANGQNGPKAVRSFIAKAISENSFSRVSQFNNPITICTSFDVQSDPTHRRDAECWWLVVLY